jgi:carbon-monoxide dehydrogenase large subunit
MTEASAKQEGLSVLDRPNSYIGKTVPRPNLDRLMQGRGVYVSDMELPRMAHVVFLRSPHAHAKILAIDVAAAKQMPGVVAVVIGKELADVITPWVGVLSHLKGLKSAPQHAIAIDRACWQGEAVAAVVATSRALAEDAAEKVQVIYQELDVVTDMRTALDPATPVIHASLGDNLAFERVHSAGEVDQAFAGSDEIVEADFVFGRHTGVTLEPRAVVADWNAAEARLTIYQGTQAPHMVQNIAALHLGLEERQVRVVCKDVGGSFGIKVHIYADEMATYALSKLLKRPIKFVADRVESFNTDIHARDHRCKGRIGVKRDGTITAFEIDDLTGIGPYSMYPRTSAIEANQVVNLVGGPYITKNYRARARVVFQNKNVMCQYRAVGHPIACSVTEGLVDLAAMRIGMDPADIRPSEPRQRRCLSLRLARGAEVRAPVASCVAGEAFGDDGLRLFARRAGRAAQEGRSSRHRNRELHRGHQSERCVLRCRRREDFIAGRRRRAAGRAGLRDLPDQHHRAGAGIGVAHGSSRRKRAGRLHGSRPRHPRRH